MDASESTDIESNNNTITNTNENIESDNNINATNNSSVNVANESTQNNVTNNIPNNNDSNNGYEVVKTAYDNAERSGNNLYDEEGAPFAIIGISYLIPIVGIVLYLTKHNEKERYARNCLLAGLFGVLTYAILGVIYSLYLIKTL